MVKLKRNVKNEIFIGIIILVIAAMFLTNYYGKKNTTNTSGPGNNNQNSKVEYQAATEITEDKEIKEE